MWITFVIGKKIAQYKIIEKILQTFFYRTGRSEILDFGLARMDRQTDAEVLTQAVTNETSLCLEKYGLSG
jgi:hypothetical protein